MFVKYTVKFSMIILIMGALYVQSPLINHIFVGFMFSLSVIFYGCLVFTIVKLNDLLVSKSYPLTEMLFFQAVNGCAVITLFHLNYVFVASFILPWILIDFVLVMLTYFKKN